MNEHKAELFDDQVQFVAQPAPLNKAFPIATASTWRGIKPYHTMHGMSNISTLSPHEMSIGVDPIYNNPMVDIHSPHQDETHLVKK